MKRDGLAEKVIRDLKRKYDAVVDEPIPQDMRELLNRLSGGGSSECA